MTDEFSGTDQVVRCQASVPTGPTSLYAASAPGNDGALGPRAGTNQARAGEHSS